jgi:hypothetical protein
MPGMKEKFRCEPLDISAEVQNGNELDRVFATYAQDFAGVLKKRSANVVEIVFEII